MLNKEKYKEELEDILANSIAVSKNGKVSYCASMKCGDCIFFRNGCGDSVKVWLNSECQECTLTDKEKAYLSAVIAPFKDKVKSIAKLSDNFPPKEYIRILIEGAAPAILPRFDKGAMYKGMIIDEEYTLEELGL